MTEATPVSHEQLLTQWLSWMKAHPDWAKELLAESTDREKVNDPHTSKTDL
ncbi:MAG: hypothetical protein F6K41_04265 [Symploca sp. SIO3E6]|nr:hypothetical protein [Caldora sp. SIO3E6]